MESEAQVELLLEPEEEDRRHAFSLSISQPTPPEDELFQAAPRRITGMAAEAASSGAASDAPLDAKTKQDAAAELYLAALRNRRPPQLAALRDVLHPTRQRAVAADGFQEAGECQICFLPWTRGGERQVCALKCGHLVCLRCLEEITARRKNKRKQAIRCPFCNAEVALSEKRGEIIPLWVHEVNAVDESRVTDLHQKMETELKRSTLLHMENSNYQKRIEHLELEIKRLKDLLNLQGGTERVLTGDDDGSSSASSITPSQHPSRHFYDPLFASPATPTENQLVTRTSTHILGEEAEKIVLQGLASAADDPVSIQSKYFAAPPPHETGSAVPAAVKQMNKLSLWHSIELKDAQVLAYDRMAHHLIVTSAVSTTSGHRHGRYGVTKISLTDPNYREEIDISASQIRDIAVQRFTGGERQQDEEMPRYFLTVGSDRNVSIFDLETNHRVFTCTSPVAPWSCCWSRKSEYLFYVGCANGTVSVYDIRKPRAPIVTLQAPPTESGRASPCFTLSAVRRSAVVKKAQDLVGGVKVKVKECLLGASSMTGVSLYVLTEPFSCSQTVRLFPEMDGRCLSAACDNKGDYCLASYRTSKTFTHASHMVFSFEPVVLNAEGPLKVKTTNWRTLFGSSSPKQLTRSHIVVTHRGTSTSLTRVFGAEAEQPRVWNCNTGDILPATMSVHSSAVLDVMCVCTESTPTLPIIGSKRTGMEVEGPIIGSKRTGMEVEGEIWCTLSTSKLLLYRT